MLLVIANAALLPGRKTDQISNIMINLTWLAFVVDRQHLEVGGNATQCLRNNQWTTIVMIKVAVVAAAAAWLSSRRSFVFCGAGSEAGLGAQVGVRWLPSARPSEGAHPKAPGQRHDHKQASNMAVTVTVKGKVARNNADWL